MSRIRDFFTAFTAQVREINYLMDKIVYVERHCTSDGRQA